MIVYLVCITFLVLAAISQNAHGLRLFPSIQADEFIFPEYIRNDTVLVNPFDHSAAIALCENGDELTAGGYYIDFTSPQILDKVHIYVDRPVLLETDTSSQEGWQTGLASNQNETVSITASVLCADLTS
jgi:hypothetical protein